MAFPAARKTLNSRTKEPLLLASGQSFVYCSIHWGIGGAALCSRLRGDSRTRTLLAATAGIWYSAASRGTPGGRVADRARGWRSRAARALVPGGRRLGVLGCTAQAGAARGRSAITLRVALPPVRPYGRPIVHSEQVWGAACLGAARDADQVRALSSLPDRSPDAVSADSAPRASAVPSVRVVGPDQGVEDQLISGPHDFPPRK